MEDEGAHFLEHDFLTKSEAEAWLEKHATEQTFFKRSDYILIRLRRDDDNVVRPSPSIPITAVRITRISEFELAIDYIPFAGKANAPLRTQHILAIGESLTLPAKITVHVSDT
jgi:hypothetical protein